MRLPLEHHHKLVNYQLPAMTGKRKNSPVGDPGLRPARENESHSKKYQKVKQNKTKQNSPVSDPERAYQEVGRLPK